MINFTKTVDSKPNYVDNNNNVIVDLIIKDVIDNNIAEFPDVIDYFLVSDEDAMRIDLVSFKMYGNVNYAEGILKFNQISNPYAIDSGDVLYTFDIPSMEKKLRGDNNISTNRKDIRDQYLTPEKKNKIDPQLKEFEKRESARLSKTNPLLPPNYAGYDDKEIIVKNGKIVFGENVTKTTDDTSDMPLSKSDYIKKLIKNRLA